MHDDIGNKSIDAFCTSDYYDIHLYSFRSIDAFCTSDYYDIHLYSFRSIDAFCTSDYYDIHLYSFRHLLFLDVHIMPQKNLWMVIRQISMDISDRQGGSGPLVEKGGLTVIFCLPWKYGTLQLLGLFIFHLKAFKEFVYRHRTLTGIGIKSINYLDKLHKLRLRYIKQLLLCVHHIYAYSPHRENMYAATLSFKL